MDSPLSASAALLQALLAGEGYGLDLSDRVETGTQGRVKLGQGSLYPALRAMERSGLLESYESEPLPERGGKPRVYYKLTPAGMKAATSQRHAMMSFFGKP